MQNKASSDDDMLTLKEIQSALGVSRTTVLDLAKRGFLFLVKVNGKLVCPRAQVMAERERREASNKILTRPSNDLGFDNAKPAALRAAPQQRAVPKYDGEIAARSVELFNAGGSVRQAVLELHITFEVANHLWDQYKKAGPELYLSTSATMTLSRWLGIQGLPTLPKLEQAISGTKGSLDREVAALRQLQLAHDRLPHFVWDPSGRIEVWISRAGLDTTVEPDQRVVDVTECLKMTLAELEFAEWTEAHQRRAEEEAAAAMAARRNSVTG